jgi:hypothetical protein
MKKLTVSSAALGLIAAYACIATWRTERLTGRVARLEGMIRAAAEPPRPGPPLRDDGRVNDLETRVRDIEGLLHENIVNGRLDPPKNSIRDYPDVSPRLRP